MNDVLIRPNFLPKGQCDDLIWAMKLQNKNVASNRAEMPAWLATYPPALATLRVFRDDMTQLIRSVFGEFVHLEHCVLEASVTGDSVAGVVINHTANHSHTCNLYLNGCGTDYEGGELAFPERGMTVAPAAGTLVAFPSGLAFKHEGLPIRSGVRYAVLSWFTLEEQHRMRGF